MYSVIVKSLGEIEVQDTADTHEGLLALIQQYTEDYLDRYTGFTIEVVANN